MLEPKPGHINKEYLEKVQKQVQKLTKAGIYVVLDMHQDLYSNQFADGAPDWATLDDGLPHKKGAVWSDAYFISPAVQQAFDSFWTNKKIDGLGLQDHYAKAWKHVAHTFVDNKNVLGYDLMNEPFIGSKARLIMKKLLQSFGNILYQRKGILKRTKMEVIYWLLNLQAVTPFKYFM